ncbi:hypothetical protein V2G26_021169 [Clonostachys chloroleuca]
MTEAVQTHRTSCQPRPHLDLDGCSPVSRAQNHITMHAAARPSRLLDTQTLSAGLDTLNTSQPAAAMPYLEISAHIYPRCVNLSQGPCRFSVQNASSSIK